VYALSDPAAGALLRPHRGTAARPASTGRRRYRGRSRPRCRGGPRDPDRFPAVQP